MRVKNNISNDMSIETLIFFYHKDLKKKYPASYFFSSVMELE